LLLLVLVDVVIVEVEVDELETHHHLVRVPLERLQLISDRDALVAAEASFFQGLHNGGGEVLEAGLPDAVVRRVVPNRSTLNISPGNDRVVHEGEPLAAVRQYPHSLHHGLLERLQVYTHPVVRQRVGFRL